MTRDELNELSRRTLHAAYTVHAELGPGLLETAYCACLEVEFRASGLRVRTQVPVPVIYRGQRISEVGFRMDMLVEEEIVLEIKAVEAIAPVHVAQLVSYLKLANKRLGFVINFHSALFKNGVYRRVNGF